jgi:hypothetical protein
VDFTIRLMHIIGGKQVTETTCNISAWVRYIEVNVLIVSHQVPALNLH